MSRREKSEDTHRATYHGPCGRYLRFGKEWVSGAELEVTEDEAAILMHDTGAFVSVDPVVSSAAMERNAPPPPPPEPAYSYRRVVVEEPVNAVTQAFAPEPDPDPEPEPELEPEAPTEAEAGAAPPDEPIQE